MRSVYRAKKVPIARRLVLAVPQELFCSNTEW
jgi:hypothetical protein